MPTDEEIRLQHAKEIREIASENARMEKEYKVRRKATMLTRCVREGEGWLIQFPYNPIFLSEFKECIPHDYRDWRPALKSWWVDEECGGLLAGLFGNWDIPITQPNNTMFERIKPKCLICKDKGWIPDTKTLGAFSGKPILTLERLCQCREMNQSEGYHRIRPSDFDFPCSETFRGYYYQQYSDYDPGQALVETEPQSLPEQVIVHRHSDMRKEDYNLLQQTARRIEWLEKKLVAGQKREHKPEVTTKPKYIGAI